MTHFVHLHVHSYYSQLDGMSPTTNLIEKACNCGMKAIALTDHGNMFGIKEFYDHIENKNKNLLEHSKIKPILGVEVYVANRTRFNKSKKTDLGGWHLILLAKNKHGYKNLCKLVSISWIEGFYNRPRIDKKCLEQYSDGLIVTSACLGGEIPQKILNGDEQGAEKAILWFKKIFNDDFYLEIQRHHTNKKNSDQSVYPKQIAVNQILLKLAKKTDTKIICTNDVHFVEEDHAEAHDHLICLRTGKNLNDPKRMYYTKQEWFKSIEEMNNIFSDIPESLSNTIELANKVEFYDINSKAIMPTFSIPESFGTEINYRIKYSEKILKQEFNKENELRFDILGGYDKVIRIKMEADFLKKITLQKAKNRYCNPIPKNVLTRLEFELETVKIMGFSGYFLIVNDFIQAACNMGILVGPGRGSVAGSVIAYCLGITNIDPLKYDLLFERFLNIDRISMPDIDIDFDDEGRINIVHWVTEKYGKEKVAHIVTHGTMATKSSIRDVGRVQGLSIAETEKLIKLIPNRFQEDKKTGETPEVNIKNCIKHIPQLQKARYSNNKNISDTLKYAEILEGTIRHTGVHACGVIIGSDNLTNFLPIATAKEKNTNEDVLITQYEGSVIESVGLIKMDFLGLKTLSIIKETISNIKKSKNIVININCIPNNDHLTYELYSNGQTIGVFQFESAGMQKYLRELKPTRFEDLIAMNALYRPGPMSYIPDFIDRKHSRKIITYDFPEMEIRLKDTYGITIYQEQVMLLSRDLAKFSGEEADELRIVISKKLKNKMEQFYDKFIQGAIKNGFGPKQKLEKIWNDWTKFAQYAFNKSHATCYSWISYQTAYLKAHYPAEFLAANLTQNRDDISNITKFINECCAMGIKILGPDINKSDLNFVTNKKKQIRFGLTGIKGITQNTVENIVNERIKNGFFKNIFDFVERINLNICSKKSIEILCLSGAFDSFKEIKREHFFKKNSKGISFTEALIHYGNKFQIDKNSTSYSLFINSNMAIEIVKPEIPLAETWSNIERLSKEKELLGTYISSHPLDEYYLMLKYVCTLNINNFEKAKITNHNQELTFGGIVSNSRKGNTKSGTPFTSFKLKDFTGNKDFFLFGKDHTKYGTYCYDNAFLLIKGKFTSSQYSSKKIIFKIISILSLNEKKQNIKQNIIISLPLQQINEQMIVYFSSMIKNKCGCVSLCFNIEYTTSKEQTSLLLISKNEKYFVDKKFIQYLEKNKIKFEVSCQP
ncbi:MAG: DNA polymerase III subunit alpha [Bacteroidales bacterium OttesenSCG-928-I14]|jgi:DNA polymerase-3 subunit alpha|nr:DNA polymerase III subunit alpha [Bacteroidales bacterium OttesenSCG-928-I14]